MAVVGNSIRIGRWSELMVVCVLPFGRGDDKLMLMRQLESLGRHSQGALWESAFRTAKMEKTISTASWLPLASVVPGCQSEW